MKIFVADIGNSYTKTGIWHNAKLHSIKKIPTAELKISAFESNLPSAASCVVPEVEKRFSSKVKLWVNTNLSTGVDFSVINSRQIGSDRVSGAYAAVHLYPNENVIVIHCGTAMVIDALNKNKKFLGGAILPGISTMAFALNQNTAKLPLLDIKNLKRKITACGRTTESAIISGIKYGSVGAIKELVKNISSEHKFKKFRLIFTGGNAELLLDFFPKSVYIKSLVLLGTALIAEKFYESENLRNSQR